MGPSCIWQLWACFLSYLPVFGHAGIVKDASQQFQKGPAGFRVDKDFWDTAQAPKYLGCLLFMVHLRP